VSRIAYNDCPLAVVGVFHVPSARTSTQQRTDVNVTNKSSTKNFKPEQKHNNEMLLIAPTSRPNNGKRFVQATPAVGFFNFQISPKDKASFLLFIKNNKKCKRMKFRLNR
jgi:hypothetical protein